MQICTQRQFLFKCSSSFLAGSCPYATRYHEKTKGELSSISHFFNFWDGCVSFGLKVLWCPSHKCAQFRQKHGHYTSSFAKSSKHRPISLPTASCFIPKMLTTGVPKVSWQNSSRGDFCGLFCQCFLLFLFRWSCWPKINTSHNGPHASVSRLKAKGWRRHWSWHQAWGHWTTSHGRRVSHRENGAPLGLGPLNHQPYIHRMWWVFIE